MWELELHLALRRMLANVFGEDITSFASCWVVSR